MWRLIFSSLAHPGNRQLQCTVSVNFLDAGTVRNQKPQHSVQLTLTLGSPKTAALAVLIPTAKGAEPLTLSVGGPIYEVESELPALLEVLREAVAPFREAIKLR